MKCDELKYEYLGKMMSHFPCSTLVIRKQFVDAAIAELKQKIHDAEMAKDDAEAANTEYREDIRKLKAENERLRADNERLEKECSCKFYKDCLRVLMLKREKQQALRSLWMARALALSRFDVDKYIRTHMMSNYWKCGDEIFVLACKIMQNKIDKTKEILIEKAKEYK